MGPISGISLVLAPVSRSAGTMPFTVADSRNGTVPSAAVAPRISLPSQFSDGSSRGRRTGNVTGPAGSRAARNAAVPSARACAPSAPSTRDTVFLCGGTRLPCLSRRAPAAARTSGPAWAIHAVTSSSSVLPDSSAAVTRSSTQGREWRMPRGSRGSGTAAKQPGRLPAAASITARPASAPSVSCAASRSLSSSAASRTACSASAITARAAAGAGMQHWTGNGASRRVRDVRIPLS